MRCFVNKLLWTCKSLLLFFILLHGTLYAADRLVFENFEDQQWRDSFDNAFNVDNVSIISFNSANSGSYVARMYGGYLGASFDWNVSVSEGDSFYIKYYVYYPSSWSWAEISDTNMKQFRAQGTNGYPVFVYRKAGGGSVRTHGEFTSYSGGGVCSDLSWNGPVNTPSLQAWHKVEMYVSYANTGGGFWWKVNDVIVSQYNGTLNCDTWPSAERPITNLRICGGNGFPTGDFYYIDDIEIWNGLPGGSGAIFPGVGTSLEVAKECKTCTSCGHTSTVYFKTCPACGSRCGE